ncbi:hypothetical protein BD779DRAFT_985103 [Infundibulicybe gibba]|nr:hypothetical protein BD779DRAFT_985103 [Infundibulicybe gibba]
MRELPFATSLVSSIHVVGGFTDSAQTPMMEIPTGRKHYTVLQSRTDPLMESDFCRQTPLVRQTRSAPPPAARRGKYLLPSSKKLLRGSQLLACQRARRLTCRRCLFLREAERNIARLAAVSGMHAGLWRCREWTGLSAISDISTPQSYQHSITKDSCITPM